MDWATLLRELGVLAGLVVFFAWTSWLREQRLATRIDALEQFVEHELMKALSTAANASLRQAETLDALIKVLTARPCLLQDCKVIDQRIDDALVKLGLAPKKQE